MYDIQMPIFMRDIMLPVIISSTFWLSLLYGFLLKNLVIFVIISIIYVYYCKWVNGNYEHMFREETIDEKLKDMNSLSRNLITTIWVSHFAFFFFGGISLGVSVPFMIYFSF
tara:strand:- start:885 stop:1220 length:336 start_codon:yes stop_codon:yes gene_type:complete